MADKRRDESTLKRRSQEDPSDYVPPKKSTLKFNLNSNSASKNSAAPKLLKPGATNKRPARSPIALKLGKGQSTTEPPVLKKSSKVAAIFNEESDSEPEEIPPEARMRMKNIGRDTPTSSGPSSFNKGKLGFCDAQRMWEKRQEEIARKHQKEN